MIIASGCSIVRKTALEDVSKGREKTISIEDLKSSNLTGSDFQIQKALIDITGEAGEQKMTANMKYCEPGTYLVSLRGMSGIEAVRFYVNDDTILINDRLNKRVYHGSTEYLMNKYGISVKYLPLIVGDIIIKGTDNEYINCNENELRIIEKNGDNDIIYTLNCSTGKVNYIETENSKSGKGFNIHFEKFIKGDNINFYRNIKITDETKENTILIVIERISREEVNDLIFIPGKNYEDVILR